LAIFQIKKPARHRDRKWSTPKISGNRPAPVERHHIMYCDEKDYVHGNRYRTEILKQHKRPVRERRQGGKGGKKATPISAPRTNTGSNDTADAGPAVGIENCCVREFWAVIDTDGYMVRGRNVARTTHLGTGVDEVFFTGEVSTRSGADICKKRRVSKVSVTPHSAFGNILL
jgi:hypothetical protein